MARWSDFTQDPATRAQVIATDDNDVRGALAKVKIAGLVVAGLGLLTWNPLLMCAGVSGLATANYCEAGFEAAKKTEGPVDIGSVVKSALINTFKPF